MDKYPFDEWLDVIDYLVHAMQSVKYHTAHLTITNVNYAVSELVVQLRVQIDTLSVMALTVAAVISTP